MFLADAMEIFEIQDKRSISADNIKKIYRKKAKRYHPDVVGSLDKMTELNSAKEVLDSYVCSMESLSEEVDTVKELVIIPIDSLGRVMDTGYMVNNTLYEFKHLMKKFNVMFEVTAKVRIVTENEIHTDTYKRLVKFSQTNKYIASINIEGIEKGEVQLDLECCNQVKSIKTKCRNITFRFITERFNLELSVMM